MENCSKHCKQRSSWPPKFKSTITIGGYCVRYLEKVTTTILYNIIGEILSHIYIPICFYSFLSLSVFHVGLLFLLEILVVLYRLSVVLSYTHETFVFGTLRLFKPPWTILFILLWNHFEPPCINFFLVTFYVTLNHVRSLNPIDYIYLISLL